MHVVKKIKLENKMITEQNCAFRCGLESPPFRLTAERANRLRHEGSGEKILILITKHSNNHPSNTSLKCLLVL